MNTQHTPGPWRQKESQFGGITTHSVNFGPLGTVDYCEVSGPNAEANARLIAAAPELLEALKALLSEAESRFDYVDVTEDEVEAVAKAKAAIAKATEGQTK